MNYTATGLPHPHVTACYSRVIAAALVAAAALLMTAATTPRATAADPASELAGFATSFKDFRLDSVSGGQVLCKPCPLMAFNRGIAVQSAFIIQAPVKDVAAGLSNWSGVRHDDLKVYLHENAAKDKDISGKLGSLNNASYKRFLKASEQGTAGVQVSKAEADELKKGNIPAAWGRIVSARVTGSGSVPYDVGGETITAKGDARSILNSNAFLGRQFPALTSASGLGNGGAPYWEFIDVQGTGAIIIGTIATKPAAGGSIQLLDWQYYASGGFYTNLVFYQLWPVQVGGREATLVWRGDFLSVPESAESRGMGRMGATAIMQQEIKKVALYLQQDLKK